MIQLSSTSRNNYPEYQIKVSLNPILCNTTFKNTLRMPLKSKGDNLLADSTQKPKIKREQISHIFTGEENAKQPSHKACKYIESNVMFNDTYVDNNPKIAKSKGIRYEVEKQIKSSNHLYSDDLFISEKRTVALERKLKDTYGSNPLAILTQEQTESYNKAQLDRFAKRTEAIGCYMGSNSLKKTFKSMNKDNCSNEQIPKIINENNKLINQNENKKLRQFRKSSFDHGYNPLNILY